MMDQFIDELESKLEDRLDPRRTKRMGAGPGGRVDALSFSGVSSSMGSLEVSIFREAPGLHEIRSSFDPGSGEMVDLPTYEVTHQDLDDQMSREAQRIAHNITQNVRDEREVSSRRRRHGGTQRSSSPDRSAICNRCAQQTETGRPRRSSDRRGDDRRSRRQIRAASMDPLTLYLGDYMKDLASVVHDKVSSIREFRDLTIEEPSLRSGFASINIRGFYDHPDYEVPIKISSIYTCEESLLRINLDFDVGPHYNSILNKSEAPTVPACDPSPSSLASRLIYEWDSGGKEFVDEVVDKHYPI